MAARLRPVPRPGRRSRCRRAAPGAQRPGFGPSTETRSGLGQAGLGGGRGTQEPTDSRRAYRYGGAEAPRGRSACGCLTFSPRTHAQLAEAMRRKDVPE